MEKLINITNGAQEPSSEKILNAAEWINAELQSIGAEETIKKIEIAVRRELSIMEGKAGNIDQAAKLRRDDINDIAQESYCRMLEKISSGDATHKIVIDDGDDGQPHGRIVNHTLKSLIRTSVSAATKAAWSAYYKHPTAATYSSDDDGNEFCIIDIYAGPTVKRPQGPEEKTMARGMLDEILREYHGDKRKAKTILALKATGYTQAEIGSYCNLSKPRINQIIKALQEAAAKAGLDTRLNEAARELITRIKEINEAI